MIYHEGELEVQARADARAMAQRVGRGIHAVMPSVVQDFLRQQTLAVTSSVNAGGQVWASLLTGAPGFLNPLNAQTLRILARPAAGDVLLDNLAVNPNIGLIVIQLAQRQRVRLNGTAEARQDGLHMTLQQAYSNCQKYIQARTAQVVVRTATHSHQSDALLETQQQWIAQADTLFIASFHPAGGADASHRGGPPGFVRVLDSATLEFPDYSGNRMFNTLGNLTANPRAGLLFLDFKNGNTLQLTGRTAVIWEAERAATFPGAERVVEFHIEQTIEIANAIPFQFEALEHSPSGN